jgi:outer membrane protease
MRASFGTALVCLILFMETAAAQQTRLASGLSDEAGWQDENLSFGLSGGWLTGQSHELVYEDGEKISELIWDLDHAFVLNADFSFRLLPALRLNAGASFGGHIDSHMEDYDWLGLDYGVTDWTDRSTHEDTELDYFTRVDLNLQYDFLRMPVLTLGGLLGARVTGIQWSAYGGDYVYTSDPATSFRDEIGSFTDGEIGITYEQAWLVPYIGIAASLDMGDLRISASAVGSPLAYGTDDDVHWLRDLNFLDDLEPTNFLGAAAELTYRYGPQYQFFVNATAERYFRTSGDTTLIDITSGASAYYGGDVSGADHENFQISVGMRVTN